MFIEVLTDDLAWLWWRMELQGSLLKPAAASERLFAALFILDVQWKLQGSAIFTDPGVKTYAWDHNSVSWARSSAVNDCL